MYSITKAIRGNQKLNNMRYKKHIDELEKKYNYMYIVIYGREIIFSSASEKEALKFITQNGFLGTAILTQVLKEPEVIYTGYYPQPTLFKSLKIKCLNFIYSVWLCLLEVL